MNSDVERFLAKNNISVAAINSVSGSRIFVPEEINSIIAEYGIFKPKEIAKVNIRDILGYDREWRGIPENIIASLGFFFDSTGSTYLSRSVGILEYSSEEIIEKLRNSFEIDPMYLKEMDSNKYQISTNGLHRYTVLRIHYLNELVKAGQDPQQLERLQAKYEIPVRLERVDHLKTYCKFLLSTSNSVMSLESELDDRFRLTGRVKLKDSSNGQFTLDDEQLLEFTKDKMVDLTNNPYYSSYIGRYAEKYETFKSFIDQHFPNLLASSNKDIASGGMGV